ncbi:hypothetical protein TNCV_1221981 [Trichonephila clavipes]|nr:hypothetical protein TNCV_1221981 [Trichonephila clavipes]
MKSATVHPFLSVSFNGFIASTHLTSDLSNLPLSVQYYDLFQTLTVARNELESFGEAFFQLQQRILNHNATEIFTIRLRIASYKHLLTAEFRCATAPAIHSLDTKF